MIMWLAQYNEQPTQALPPANIDEVPYNLLHCCLAPMIDPKCVRECVRLGLVSNTIQWPRRLRAKPWEGRAQSIVRLFVQPQKN